RSGIGLIASLSASISMPCVSRGASRKAHSMSPRRSSPHLARALVVATLALGASTFFLARTYYAERARNADIVTVAPAVPRETPFASARTTEGVASPASNATDTAATKPDDRAAGLRRR